VADCNHRYADSIVNGQETIMTQQAADSATRRLPTTAALLERWITEGGCLGGQVWAWQAGRVVTSFAAGRSTPDRAASVTDVSRLYCAVKPLAACILARAADDGQLSLDDLACRYLPAFSKDGRDAITLRQLLSHGSRLPDLGLNPYTHSFGDILRVACDIRIDPRTWDDPLRYSDLAAWVILASVAENVYATDFPRIVADMLARHVPGSGLRIIDPDPAQYAPCHIRRHGRFSPVPQPSEDVLFSTANPAHGGFGSARDLGLLYAELLRSGAGTGTLLSPRTAAELTRHHTTVEFGIGFARRNCGLGFMTNIGSDGIAGDWSERSFGHAGYVGRYRVVHAFADIRHQIAVAIQLFSVGAKNNWRFQQLGAALWTDLGSVAWIN
jgi:CubicO group peptidase (beta-lactamase class C family)